MRFTPGDLVKCMLSDSTDIHCGLILEENDGRQLSYNVLFDTGEVKRVWEKYLEVIDESR